MGMFKSEKPRAYSHQYIYVDERKEKLKKIEEKAKRDLGMLPPEESTVEERIRGKFVEQTSHLKRQQEKGKPSSSKWLIIIAVLLVALIYALLN